MLIPKHRQDSNPGLWCESPGPFTSTMHPDHFHSSTVYKCNVSNSERDMEQVRKIVAPRVTKKRFLSIYTNPIDYIWCLSHHATILKPLLNADLHKRPNVTHIIWYFGIFLLAIDGEMEVPGTLNCSSRDLTEYKTIYISGEIKQQQHRCPNGKH